MPDSTATLVAADGTALPLHVARWMGPPPPEEIALLETVAAPVLDIGCGPGRHVLALAQRGKVTLGIDIAPSAIEIARERGAPVLQRSVFDEVPGAGRWATALLLDGNIGIGGHPTLLLTRIRDLLAPNGAAIVEVERAGVGVEPIDAWIRTGDQRSGPFPWCRVGMDGIDGLGRSVGLSRIRAQTGEGRWFVTLARG